MFASTRFLLFVTLSCPTAWGLPSIFPNTPSSSKEVETRRKLMSDEKMNKIKKDYNLKNSANPSMQFLSPKDMVLKANGRRYQLGGMEKFSILTDDAKVSINGKPVSYKSSLWRGKVEDSTVLMRKSPKGKVEYVNFNDGSKSTSFVALDPDEEENIFIEMKQEDLDEELLSTYILKEKHVPNGENRALASGINSSEWRTILEENHRNLQKGGACPSKKEIEVAIAFDHTFCNLQGGQSNAVKKVETIVGMASDLYAPLCIQLKISAIDGYCSRSGDPYYNMDMTRSGCGSGGLLKDFQNYWNSKYGNVRRDTAHIFVGSPFRNDGGVIGCAYIGALCDSYAYGTNDMSFSSNENLLATLLAHELGHNNGAGHASSGTVMAPSINSGGEAWASDSRNSIGNYVGSRQCVATVDGGGGGGGDGDGGGDGGGGTPTDGDLVEIKNGSKCLTVPKGQTASGTKLTVGRCNRRAASRQRWKLTKDGYIQITLGSKRSCAAISKVTSGVPIILQSCKGRSTQKWQFTNDGAIRSNANKQSCFRHKSGKALLGGCNRRVRDHSKWTVRSV